MRSRAEIAFRVRQEAGNLRMWLAAPRVSREQPAPLAGLPAPHGVAAALRGTGYAIEIEKIAAQVLDHRFPLLGGVVETGPDIEWRRDYSSGLATPPRYFRRIPYLDARRAGDHKVIWELNRHQHWAVLAQAFLLTGNPKFFEEIRTEFESWTRQNPFLCGINWTSALEAAFRALSWMWVYHLTGNGMDAGLRRRFLAGLYLHGRYIERNLSVYFSPNTHLLGEAVALHALGALFPAFPEARRWADTGGRIVREQMQAQVRGDGSHFEQSTYYHVYALDMFLFHAVLAGASAEYRSKLAHMADYACGLLGPARTLPFLGDDDGGRFFHPYGERDRFGRATLATAAALLESSAWGSTAGDAHEQAAWWLGPGAVTARSAPLRSRFGAGTEPRASASGSTESKLYSDAGIAVMSAGAAHLVVDAGPFGSGSGGHSHSDTLSLVVRLGEEDVLIDPGAYTYVGDPEWRNRFRGSAAHNTIRVDGRDQATPAGPFRWLDKPRVEIRHWSTGPAQDCLEAVVKCIGFEHRRRVVFVKPDLVFVLDEVSGGEGEHLVEQFWHAGAPVRTLEPGCFAIGSSAVMAMDSHAGNHKPQAELSEGGEHGWRSRALGMKEPAPVIRVSQNTTLPVRLATMLDLRACNRPCRVSIIHGDDQAIELLFESRQTGIVRFPRGAQPECRLGVSGGK